MTRAFRYGPCPDVHTRGQFWKAAVGQFSKAPKRSSIDQKQVGEWPANNHVENAVVAKYNLTGLSNGDYVVQDKQYPSHDGPKVHYKSNEAAGPAGMIKLQPFFVNGIKHSDVGVHAGRKRKGGVNAVTDLCIRTSDMAMSMIRMTIQQDPLRVLNVRGNDHVRGRPLALHS